LLAWRELRPDPIGSDTSCRELAAISAGEADTAAASSFEARRDELTAQARSREPVQTTRFR
jgi:hypothetical protein